MSHAHLIRPRNLMWLPAAALVVWGVLAAAGVPLTPNSGAASSGGSTVTANVLGTINVGGTCIGATRTGNIAPGNDDTDVGASCTVTVDTTDNLNGARLRAESARPSGVAMCQAAVAIACGAVASFPDAPTGGIGDISNATGGFGLRPTGMGSCIAPMWTANTTYGLPADADLTPGGPASTEVCNVPMGTTGTVTLNYRVDPIAAQTAGNYNASVVWFGEAK